MKNLMYAFRYFIKSKGNNITRTISITLGLAVSLLVFSYVTFEASYDRFMPDRERIYQMWAGFDGGIFSGTDDQMYGLMAPTLMELSPQIEAATRYRHIGRHQFRHGEDHHFATGILADSMFFDVLDYGVVRGNPREALADRNRVMLSESTALRIFGDRDPMGEILEYSAEHGNLTFTVSGIFRDIPRNTQMGTFDILLSFELAEKFGFYVAMDGGSAYPTFLKLRPGSEIGQIEAQMNRYLEENNLMDDLKEYGMRYFFAPLTKSKQTGSQVGYLSLALATIAFLTLFIAAMNYVLISISMLLKRGRTMAMLRCNGASRRDIFVMFLWETLFILIASLILVILILFAVDGPVGNLLGISMSDLFAPERIWSPLLVILAMFALAGIIPARIFASVPVTSAFKGNTSGRRGWKKALLFAQLTIVAFVVMLLLITVRQFNHMAYSDYGYNSRNLLFTNLVGTPSNLDAWKRELASMPEIAAVGASYDMPISGYSGQPAYDDITREMLFSARTSIMYYDYIPVMEMPILEGRNFREDEAPRSVIVNEEYVRRRGWPEGTATGRRIIDRADQVEPYTIVGVIGNFWMGYGGSIEPSVFHNAADQLTREDGNYRSGYIMIRVSEVSPEVIDKVSAKIKSFYGRDFEVEAYDTYLEYQLTEVKMFRNIMLLVTLVALVIALTGLIGYINEEINRRSKEIAIRKVNGAGRRQVIELIARDATIVTIPAIVVGGAGAYFLGHTLLTLFPQKTPLSWWIFLLGALMVVAVVYIVELARTWKISGSNPVDSLKSE